MTQPNRSRGRSESTTSRRQQDLDVRLREKVRAAKARGRAYEARRMPPVMVRGGLEGASVPVRKVVRNRARRRFDLALSIPGAEIQLPALPQVSLGARFFSALLVAALTLLAYHLWNSPSYRVEAVEVVGLQRLTSHDVNALLDVAGEPVFAIDANRLREKVIKAFPEFSSVTVEVALPNLVKMTVEERLPILAWKQDGRTVLVDANGVAFPLRDQTGSLPAVVVEAFSSPPSAPQDVVSQASLQFMPVEMVSAILSMSAQAPAGTPLIYDALHGLGWKDAAGWEVYFGDIRDIEMKLRVYQALVKRLQGEGLQPALISVEYVHSPYYRLER